METVIDAQSVIEEETHAQLGTYAKLPIVAVRGKGIMLYGADGSAYYDFFGVHIIGRTTALRTAGTRSRCWGTATREW